MMNGYLLSTCPDTKIRNGKEALKLALRANEQLNDVGSYGKSGLVILIAQAHAENGDYDQAIIFAKKAIEVAGPNEVSREDCESKLKLFERKMPYRSKIPNGDDQP